MNRRTLIDLQDVGRLPTAFLGYQRDYVDASIAMLKQTLEAERQAAADARDEADRLREEMEAGQLLGDLGGEAANALREAGESAALIVESARKEAEAIVRRAREEADHAAADGEQPVDDRRESAG